MEEPIAFRGGVLLLPLEADRHGDQWPTTMDVRPEQGDRLTGTVVWIGRQDEFAEMSEQALRWTRDPTRLHARPIQTSDDSSAGNGRPFLLIDLPHEVGGALGIEGETINPTWFARPQGPASGMSGQLQRTWALNRPDAESPFSHWRWVLLADRLNMQPPPPKGLGGRNADPGEGTETSAAASARRIAPLIATYYADLWRFAIARIREGDHSAADETQRLLTATCRNDEIEVAAWESDPTETGRLLGELLDLSKSTDDVVRAAREWNQARDLVHMWLVRDVGNRVEYAMLNPHSEAILVEFRWRFENPARDREEIPIGINLLPGRITRAIIDRPGVEQDILGREQPITPALQMKWKQTERIVPVRPGRHIAQPPGVYFFPFQLPLSMRDAVTGGGSAPGDAHATSAMFRRLNERWEIFFTCYRPPVEDDSTTSGGAPLMNASSYEDARGIEAVTLFIGPKDQPRVALTIPESGFRRFWRGNDDGTLSVHKRSYRDRWYCRVIVPDGWLRYPTHQTVQPGFVRTMRDSMMMLTSPNASPEWRSAPGRIEIDTSHWRDWPG